MGLALVLGVLSVHSLSGIMNSESGYQHFSNSIGASSSYIPKMGADPRDQSLDLGARKQLTSMTGSKASIELL